MLDTLQNSSRAKGVLVQTVLCRLGRKGWKEGRIQQKSASCAVCALA